jgi:outer membrane autotransporter protein
MHSMRSYFSLKRAVSGCLCLPPFLFLIQSPTALAARIIEQDTEITGQTPRDSYEVRGGATLTASGADTQAIYATRGSALVMDGSAVTSAQASDPGTGAITAGNAIIRNSQLVNQVQGRAGLAVTASIAGSQVTFSNGSISSVGRGVFVGPAGNAGIEGSSVSSSTQMALDVLNGTAMATGSLFSGQGVGARVGSGTVGGQASTLSLFGSQVVGHNGAALELGVVSVLPGEVNVLLAEGTVLNGSDGVAIHAVSNTTGSVVVDNSAIDGDFVGEAGSAVGLTLRNSAQWTGRLGGVKSLAVDSGAQWNMVQSARLSDLSLGGGTVRMGSGTDFYTLQVDRLAGNGNFELHTDFSTDATDLLQLTGTSSGDHTLTVAATGAEAATGNDIRVVETNEGGAQFSLAGTGRVDVGAYQYGLSQQGNDWYLTPTQDITPGTASVLALFNTATTVWYGEMATLRSRMGELRLDSGHAGGWLRTYGNKLNVSASNGLGYQQYQRGVSFGVDSPLPIGDGQWLGGVLAGYSQSDLDLQQGTTGEVNSVYLGAYATWLDKTDGYYFDGSVKANRLRNQSKVTLSDASRAKGNYATSGLGATAEFGRHFTLEDGWFVEPYTQWSAVVFQGKDYRLDNGMVAERERTHSLLGKLGTTAGRAFAFGKGRQAQPYVRVAYAHEFARNNPVSVNAHRFDNDLSGSRAEFGVGAAVSMNDRLQLHTDFDYSHGDNIEQPWGANIGVRYNW